MSLRSNGAETTGDVTHTWQNLLVLVDYCFEPRAPGRRLINELRVLSSQRNGGVPDRKQSRLRESPCRQRRSGHLVLRRAVTREQTVLRRVRRSIIGRFHKALVKSSRVTGRHVGVQRVRAATGRSGRRVMSAVAVYGRFPDEGQRALSKPLILPLFALYGYANRIVEVCNSIQSPFADSRLRSTLHVFSLVSLTLRYSQILRPYTKQGMHLDSTRF